MSVLCDGQDDAIVLLRRPLVVIIVAMTFAGGVLVGQGMSGMMLSGRGKLLEEMMHPVRRGRSEKNPERRNDAQVYAALESRDWSSAVHRSESAILVGPFAQRKHLIFLL